MPQSLWAPGAASDPRRRATSTARSASAGPEQRRGTTERRSIPGSRPRSARMPRSWPKGKEVREISADARGPQRPGGFGIRPPAHPRREVDEGRGIHLDDVGRGPAGVTWPLDDLCRPEWGNADLDSRARRLLGEQLKQVAHGRRGLGPAGGPFRDGSESGASGFGRDSGRHGATLRRSVG